MDIISSSPIFLLVTLFATWLMAFAYKNTKFSLKHKVGHRSRGGERKLARARSC